MIPNPRVLAAQYSSLQEEVADYTLRTQLADHFGRKIEAAYWATKTVGSLKAAAAVQKQIEGQS